MLGPLILRPRDHCTARDGVEALQAKVQSTIQVAAFLIRYELSVPCTRHIPCIREYARIFEHDDDLGCYLGATPLGLPAPASARGMLIVIHVAH